MSRDTTESTRSLDFPRLRELNFFPKEGAYRIGNIQWSSNGRKTADINLVVNTLDPAYIRMQYKVKNRWESEEEYRNYEYQFPLEKVECNFGGFKWYVRCGLTKGGNFCNKRVRSLYSAGDYFGCRHCAGLTYESCNTGRRFRNLVTLFDLDEEEFCVKRRFYAGKPTRKYQRLLRREERLERALALSGNWLKELGL